MSICGMPWLQNKRNSSPHSNTAKDSQSNFQSLWCYIRVIPQETVDNNLGPDRLAGPKALDPIYRRQPTLWLHDLCMEVQTVHCIELRLFWAKLFPILIIFMSCIWHRSSRNFYRIYLWRGFGRELNPSPPQRRAKWLTVTPQTRVTIPWLVNRIPLTCPCNPKLYLCTLRNPRW